MGGGAGIDGRSPRKVDDRAVSAHDADETPHGLAAEFVH
jgi:hypothetical protein